MGFKRLLRPKIVLREEELTSALIGIGFRLGGGPPETLPNIEDSIFYASIESIQMPDYRLMSLLVDWLSIHSRNVNIDRLSQLVLGHSERRLLFFWAAIAQWLKSDSRWNKIAKNAPSGRMDLLESGTKFLISKHGEDKRFKDTCIRVPKKTLRERKEDILQPEELTARHMDYYFRLILGPTYRADMWSYLQKNPKADTADVARSAYGSFSTALTVRRNFLLIKNSKKLKRRHESKFS